MTCFERFRRDLRSDESGQSMTEEALLLSGLLLVGGYSLMAWAPEMLGGITTYVFGIYVVLGYPIG